MKAVWSNLFFLWNRYELKGMKAFKYFMLYVFYILSMILTAVMAVVVPAMAISIFSKGEAIWKVLVAVATLGLAQTLQKLLYRRSYMIEMNFRILEMGRTTKYLMSLPAEDMQGTQGREVFGYATQANYMGNEQGSEAFLRNFWDLIASFISILVYVFMTVKLEWFWIPLILLPSVGRGILTWKYNQYAKSQDALEQELFLKREYLERMTLRSEAAKDHRLFPMKRLFMEKFKENREEIRRLFKNLYRRLYCRDSVGVALELIRDALCFILLLGRIKEGMAVSEFVLYYGIIISLGSYVHSCFDNAGKLARNSVIVSNYQKVFNRMPYHEGDWTEHIPPGRAKVSLEGVWYRYDDDSPWVIEDMNLVIHPGEKIALVGENGAGKTTMMKLVCGILTPVRGRVLINGVDIQNVNPKECYKYVSMVFQEVLIFAMTLGENICCCSEKLIDEERLWKVIDQAGLTDAIRSLPKGWRTPMTTYLNSKGIDLSGGQNQRLMLARALYKGGEFLVLDEPTSALDPLAEEALYKEYYAFAKDQTTVFISHRLSSTQFCDRILFLKDGQIAQSGSHEELSSQKGPYQTMFRTQAKYYQEEMLA